MVMRQTVIITGAGAAGLMAATRLRHNFYVIILEAQARIGGRIHSQLCESGIIEAGAEFVHGKLPVTLGLLKEAGIAYEEVDGEMYRRKNGQLTIAGEMIEGWGELMKKMEAVKEDITMQQLLDIHYAGNQYAQLRTHAKNYAAGFDLADIKTASVQSLYKEWNAEQEKNYRIPGGYGKMIEHLQQQLTASGCKIYTDTIAKEVHWQAGSVEVLARNGEKYYGEKLLLTVPVSVFQQADSAASIRFTPGIHFDSRTADDIGFGAVVKVAIKFRHACWPDNAGFMFSDELFPTWWTQSPDATPLLTGWAGGPNAVELSSQTDEMILETALSSLSNILDKPVSFLKENIEYCRVFNWQTNEFIKGGYSFSTPLSREARNLIKTPLDGTLFFAGEALYEGDHPGTVEAALVSGIETSELIHNSGVTRNRASNS